MPNWCLKIWVKNEGLIKNIGKTIYENLKNENFFSDCEDINECENGEIECGVAETCVNFIGSYACQKITSDFVEIFRGVLEAQNENQERPDKRT